MDFSGLHVNDYRISHEPRHPPATPTTSATQQFVGFRLDGEDYAIAITKIQEIIVMKPITWIPQVPGSIEGLINLRGSVIPVVNLRTLFGLSHKKLDDETRTIIVNVGGRIIG